MRGLMASLNRGLVRDRCMRFDRSVDPGGILLSIQKLIACDQLY
jgi:hypothetical protein